MEDFEKHPTVINLMNRVNPTMIATKTYYTRKGGKQITQEQACANNVAFDPERAATPTLTRVIPTAAPSSGASSSSDADAGRRVAQRRM